MQRFAERVDDKFMEIDKHLSTQGVNAVDTAGHAQTETTCSKKSALAEKDAQK